MFSSHQIEIAHRLVSREMQSLVAAFQAVDRSYYGDSYNEDYRRWDFNSLEQNQETLASFSFFCRRLYSVGYDVALAVKNVYDIVHGLISRDGSWKENYLLMEDTG